MKQFEFGNDFEVRIDDFKKLLGDVNDVSGIEAICFVGNEEFTKSRYENIVKIVNDISGSKLLWCPCRVEGALNLKANELCIKFLVYNKESEMTMQLYPVTIDDESTKDGFTAGVWAHNSFEAENQLKLMLPHVNPDYIYIEPSWAYPNSDIVEKIIQNNATNEDYYCKADADMQDKLNECFESIKEEDYEFNPDDIEAIECTLDIGLKTTQEQLQRVIKDIEEVGIKNGVKVPTKFKIVINEESARNSMPKISEEIFVVNYDIEIKPWQDYVVKTDFGTIEICAKNVQRAKKFLKEELRLNDNNIKSIEELKE